MNWTDEEKAAARDELVKVFIGAGVDFYDNPRSLASVCVEALAAVSAGPEPAKPSVNEMGEFIEAWGITNARGIGTLGSSRLASELLAKFWPGGSDV